MIANGSRCRELRLSIETLIPVLYRMLKMGPVARRYLKPCNVGRGSWYRKQYVQLGSGSRCIVIRLNSHLDSAQDHSEELQSA